MATGLGRKGSAGNPATSLDILQFRPGLIVWAKLRGYPWWPGIVKELSEIPKDIAKILSHPIKSNEPLVPVYFFGSYDYALVPTDCLRSFRENWSELSVKSTSVKFKEALRETQTFLTGNPLFAHHQQSAIPSKISIAGISENTGLLEKRKRGRPRKHNPDYNLARSPNRSLGHGPSQNLPTLPPKEVIDAANSTNPANPINHVNPTKHIFPSQANRHSLQSLRRFKGQNEKVSILLEYRIKLQKILLRSQLKGKELPIGIGLLKSIRNSKFSNTDLQMYKLPYILERAQARPEIEKANQSLARNIELVLRHWKKLAG